MALSDSATPACNFLILAPVADCVRAPVSRIMATAVKRQHEPQRIIGDVLSAEISEKQARSDPSVIFANPEAVVDHCVRLSYVRFFQ